VDPPSPRKLEYNDRKRDRRTQTGAFDDVQAGGENDSGQWIGKAQEPNIEESRARPLHR